jgi:hypothetical protein
MAHLIRDVSAVEPGFSPEYSALPTKSGQVPGGTTSAIICGALHELERAAFTFAF